MKQPATKDVVIDNMGKPFTVKAYVDPQPAQQEFVSPGGGYVPAISAQQALDKMAENAREQPAQKCSYPYCGCNSKAWCKVERNEALDKMAENARELGLDYEPAQQEPHKMPIPPGQADMTDICYAEGWNACCDAFFGGLPPPEPLIVTVEREVPAQRTWVGLTPEELDEMFSKTLKGKKLVNWVARAIEAKLRSKNEDRN